MVRTFDALMPVRGWGAPFVTSRVKVPLPSEDHRVACDAVVLDGERALLGIDRECDGGVESSPRSAGSAIAS
jgi:hypothetical protein